MEFLKLESLPSPAFLSIHCSEELLTGAEGMSAAWPWILNVQRKDQTYLKKIKNKKKETSRVGIVCDCGIVWQYLWGLKWEWNITVNDRVTVT